MYQRIKALCDEKGISITRLCVELTGSKGNLSTWKKGNIRPDILTRIAEILEVSTDYLLGNESELSKPTKEDIKFALFNGIEGITDEMYDEVKQFAEMVKMREEAKRRSKNEA